MFNVLPYNWIIGIIWSKKPWTLFHSLIILKCTKKFSNELYLVRKHTRTHTPSPLNFGVWMWMLNTPYEVYKCQHTILCSSYGGVCRMKVCKMKKITLACHATYQIPWMHHEGWMDDKRLGNSCLSGSTSLAKPWWLAQLLALLPTS
jgi:hypothetical protein